MTRPHPLSWLAPTLVGASAAIAGEVAAGMLLYTGTGMMRSLTTVLTVEGLALAGGLWSAPLPGSDLVDRLRVRWLACLVAFLLAACFGVAWSISPQIGAWRVGQALGLTLLAALPVYTCGMVLGGLASVAASHEAFGARGPGAPAALGAGLGFVVTGALLPRAPIPASLLVACLVLLSGGGMVLGAVLETEPPEEREKREEGEEGGQDEGEPVAPVGLAGARDEEDGEVVHLDGAAPEP